MAPFLEYAESVRGRYLDFYRQDLARWRSSQTACAWELLVKPNGAQNPEPFCLLRLDVAYQEAGALKVVRVALDPEVVAAASPTAGPTFEVENGVTVATPSGALSWEAVTLAFRSAAPSDTEGFHVGLLEPWLSKWIDDRELRKPDEETGLSGVIHSIGWGSQADGDGDGASVAWELTIDFGSAPVEALSQLLQVLGAFGVREVRLETKPE